MGCNESKIEVYNMKFDLKFMNKDSNSMVFMMTYMANGQYHHKIRYYGDKLKIFTYYGCYESVTDNNCITLENLFKDLQKIADKSGIYDESLKSSHAFESLKNNIIYTQKMFGELPIEFLGNHLLIH